MGSVFDQNEALLRQAVDALVPAQIRTVCAPNLADALATLSTIGETLIDSRLMIRAWTVIPPPGQLQSEMLDCLARLALGLWPAWYGNEPVGIEQSPSLMVSALWRQAEVQHVAPGRPQLASSSSCAMSAWATAAQRQLHRVLRSEAACSSYAPQRSILVLAALEQEQPPHRWLAFARLAEWLTAHSQSSVLIVVPSAADNEPELDSINYDAIRLAAVPPPTLLPVFDQKTTELTPLERATCASG